MDFNLHKYATRERREKLGRGAFPPVRLSRLNALLGLAEIPRELRARRSNHSEYRGILAEARPEPSIVRALKRGWLKLEGQAVRYGLQLPAGRTIIALARRVDEHGGGAVASEPSAGTS